MISIKVFVFALFLTAMYCLPNFQERYLYLGTTDNVCYFGRQSDKIRLIVNIDGLRTKTFIIEGGTECYQWSFIAKYGYLQPATYWEYMSQNQKEFFKFDDETKPIYIGANLAMLIQKTIIRENVIIDFLPYSCTIVGDGKIHHFGIDFPDQ